MTKAEAIEYIRCCECECDGPSSYAEAAEILAAMKQYRILCSDGTVEIYRESEANARTYARLLLTGRRPGCTYTLERVDGDRWIEVGQL